jgi:hypothetical protein
MDKCCHCLERATHWLTGPDLLVCPEHAMMFMPGENQIWDKDALADYDRRKRLEWERGRQDSGSDH